MRGKRLHRIEEYEWGSVWTDERDPKGGNGSHTYLVKVDDPKVLGGKTVAEVQFQHGPRNEEGSIRGCLDDHILAISQDRLEGFQAGPFACVANATALKYIQLAREALRTRAEERRARGVLGKNEQ